MLFWICDRSTDEIEIEFSIASMQEAPDGNFIGHRNELHMLIDNKFDREKCISQLRIDPYQLLSRVIGTPHRFLQNGALSQGKRTKSRELINHGCRINKRSSFSRELYARHREISTDN